MDYLYFILIIVVFLKVLFWIFYFYARSQRLRANRLQTQRSFIVVETRRRAPISHRDRAGIVENEYPQAYTNPVGPQNFPAPPAYNDCVATGQPQEEKPPSYEQVTQNPAAIQSNSTGPQPTAQPTVQPVVQATAPSPNPMYEYNYNQ